MNFCEDCSNVETLSRKRDWYYWRCLRAPADPQPQFVVAEQFLHQSPHMLCKTVNPQGECEMFEPKPKEN